MLSTRFILLAWLFCALFLQTSTAQEITAFKNGENTKPLEKLNKKYIQGLYNNRRQAAQADDKLHSEQEFRLQRILEDAPDKLYYYVGWFSPLAPEAPLLHRIMVFDKTYNAEHGGYMGVGYVIPNKEKYALSWTKKDVFTADEIAEWEVDACALRFREMAEQDGVVLDMLGLCNSDNEQAPFKHYNAYMIFNSESIACKSSFFKSAEEVLFIHDVLYDLISRKNLSATPKS